MYGVKQGKIKRKHSNNYLLLYFIILCKTKKECIELKEKICKFLEINLELELNDKSRYYPYKMGVNFCGYRIFTTHKLLRLDSKKKIKKKVKKWNYLYDKKILNTKDAIQSINAWQGHIAHCNSYYLKKKIINSCDFFYDTSTNFEKIEQNLIDDILNYKLDIEYQDNN